MDDDHAVTPSSVDPLARPVVVARTPSASSGGVPGGSRSPPSRRPSVSTVTVDQGVTDTPLAENLSGWHLDSNGGETSPTSGRKKNRNRRRSRRGSRLSVDGSSDAGGSPLEELKPSIEHTFVINPPGRVPERAPAPEGTIIHDVRATDTLSGIALKYKTSVAEIKKLNRSLRMATVLFPGQTLRVPAPEARPPSSSRVSTVSTECNNQRQSPIHMSPQLTRVMTEPPLKRVISEERLDAAIDKPHYGDLSGGSAAEPGLSATVSPDKKEEGTGDESDASLDDARTLAARVSAAKTAKWKGRYSKEIDLDVQAQVLGAGRPIRQVHTVPAVYCVDNGHVRGHLVLTEAMIIFEPRLDDYLVKKMGLLPFQQNLDISNVVDFRILGAEEEEGFRTHQKSKLKSVAAASRNGGYYHIISEDQPHSILRLLYLQKNSYENYAFFLVPDSHAHGMVKRLEKCVTNVSATEAATNATSLANQSDVHDCSSARQAAVQSLGFDPQKDKLDESELVMVEKDDADPLKDVSSFKPRMYGQSEFLSGDDVLSIRTVLPARDRFSEWVLLYSVVRHGASMHSFYSRVAHHDHTLVVMQDKFGEVFGGYATQKWAPHDAYYGTGESFLFTFHNGFKHYGWTKKNNYFMLARTDSIAMGGGGGFGFMLDSEFYYGSTGESATFGNKHLTKSDEFKCRNFEVWGLQGSTDDTHVVLPDEEFANWVEPGLIGKR